LYAEVVDQGQHLIELQGTVFLRSEHLLEDVVLHVHVPTDEEDDVLDQAYAQHGQVRFAEYVQVLVRPVQQELVYEDVQLHSQRPRGFLAVGLQHPETACVYDPHTILQIQVFGFV
jgi:hypothetical protein